MRLKHQAANYLICVRDARLGWIKETRYLQLIESLYLIRAITFLCINFKIFWIINSAIWRRAKIQLKIKLFSIQ